MRFYQYKCVRDYRRTLILRLVVLLMILVDIVSFILAPIWCFVFFMIVHAALIYFWLNLKCRALDQFIEDLLSS